MKSVRQPVPAFVQLAAHPVRWQLLAALSGGDYRVREMVSLVGEPQNLVSYHLRLLRDGGLVRVSRSSFDGRDSYYHLDLDRCTEMLAGVGAALHPGLGCNRPPVTFTSETPSPVLFVCTGNSARSAIAEALLRLRTGGTVDTTSAGTCPKRNMHPNTVRVLREEFGIDIADRHPRHLDSLAGRRFGTVITLCDKAREVCPEFDGETRRIHWSIPDPAAAGGADEETYPAFRVIAAEIDTRIRYLCETHAVTT
ncbi:ArsR family transcriptional regulator [Rhodococcus pyridinivorans]|uniref:arsenate reductase/protein-tyrosine-phosphatase family protein n=1 Tax=Rhodococcus pyridinivorans TaxID=103816 RepID=UPI0022262481|nr:ArsR family transcriptional regulator [Rhodococcus pyridinivorans]MCW3469229.1 ArsR family transcriptional regulator [Rhodococcus pyridinivorans]